MEKRHILLCGHRGVGKSTLIRKLLEDAGLPVYGFMTKSTHYREDGYHDIYIHPAEVPEEQWIMTEENWIGDCNTRHRHINIDAFEQIGVPLLRAAGKDGIIVMDELGFMEAQAPIFRSEVLKRMNEDAHIIASIKDRDDIEFINEIRACEKAQVYDIDKDNRDALYEELNAVVKAWHPHP